jgi:hypothetical protein
MLRDGQPEDAARQLDRAGRVEGRDRTLLAIRDKSNLVLGALLFEASEFDLARRSWDRVRLEGPFSNPALLRAGWAEVSAGSHERALVPWAILADREPTDPAVQEAMLALPYAYGELGVHGRAARLYGRAVESFVQELERIDSSIQSIREGAFLKALTREEIRRDEDWVVHLRRLPDAPETFYLIALLASHDFQTALQNYLDLEDLRKRLVSWEGSLDAFEELVQLRRRYYEQLLPEIDRRFRKLDAQMRLRLEQRKHIEERLQHLLIAPRPTHLATAEERRARSRLDRLEQRLGGVGETGSSTLKARIRRLRGVLTWSQETEYDQRLTDAHRHLSQLNEDVEALAARYRAFVRARQAATHGYVGYEVPIEGLRTRVEAALERLDILLARQGHLLETVAIRELVLRRERLEAYRNQARFAFADSYDRATKAQGR